VRLPTDNTQPTGARTGAVAANGNGNGKLCSHGRLRSGGAGASAAGDERRRHRRAGAPLPRRPAGRRAVLPRPRLRARHVNVPPSPCDPSSLLARVLPISCLLACLVGALGDYVVVSRDLVSDLGGSSMREKRTRI